MSRLVPALAAAFAFALPASVGAVEAAGTGRVTVTANPERVCFVARQPAYLNVDFIVRNGTGREIQVTEIRGLVLDRAGATVEKRLVWQGALDLIGLGPGARVAASGEGLVFNPLLFSAAAPGRRIRYEFDISGEAAPVPVTIVPRHCRSRAPLILPVAGRVAVLDGHDLLSHHRRFGYLAPWARQEGMSDNVQRFALDLVMVDAEGRRFRGQGLSNEDFYGWGQPVRAPAAGVVVASRDGQPDNDEIGRENRWTGRTWASSHGNHAVIDHGHGEFSVIAHMRQGTVRVRPGMRVNAGDIVGRVGNSGSSLMPHVHYQLQDGAEVRGVHGLPAYFRRLRVLGGGLAAGDGVALDSGDIVLAR
jgi:hypothetical protein